MFENKNILITGGTGSFGNYFTHKILKNYNPNKIIIFSRDELKQFEMSDRLSEFSKKIRYFIGDVRDKERLTFATKDVDIIIHAAALKQVVAAEYNPIECINTNIMGAQNVIQAAITNNVEKVIALSTDKAVNPVNLYGATKLASDKLFVSANNIVGKQKTMFSVVRYGNVVNSRGSVIPVFLNHIKKQNKYLPITDNNMTRFWITLEEGVNFVIEGIRLMIGGEIFVPKIPSIRITDLASAISNNMEQKIIGIRPGEKIHELMCPSDSWHLTYEFNKYYVITPSIEMKHSKQDYKINIDQEQAINVKENYEYSSGNNNHFLSIEEIKKHLISDKIIDDKK